MQWYRQPFHKETSENKSVLSVLKWNVLFALINQSACCIFALQFYCQQWYNLSSLCIDPCIEPRILDEVKRYHIVKVNVTNAEPFEEVDVSSRKCICSLLVTPSKAIGFQTYSEQDPVLFLGSNCLGRSYLKLLIQLRTKFWSSLCPFKTSGTLLNSVEQAKLFHNNKLKRDFKKLCSENWLF